MDEDADYGDDDDDDDDDNECDFGCEYDYNDEVDGDGDGDGLFHVDMDGEKSREVVVLVKSPDRDTLQGPELPETKSKPSIPTIQIVPPTVPPIP